MLPSDINKKVYNALVLPLLDYCSVYSLARMHKRPENEDREGAELWYAHYTLTATQNAKQEVKRQAEMHDSGEKKDPEIICCFQN